jgi:hypothetical protein
MILMLQIICPNTGASSARPGVTCPIPDSECGSDIYI